MGNHTLSLEMESDPNISLIQAQLRLVSLNNDISKISIDIESDRPFKMNGQNALEDSKIERDPEAKTIERISEQPEQPEEPQEEEEIEDVEETEEEENVQQEAAEQPEEEMYPPLSVDSKQFTLATFLYNIDGYVKASQLEGMSKGTEWEMNDSNISSHLYTLFDKDIVGRTKKGSSPYEYQLTQMGRDLVEKKCDDHNIRPIPEESPMISS